MTIQLAWRNLVRNPKRTLLLCLTIGFTTLGIFLFDGFNAGILNQYRVGIAKGLIGNGQVFTAGYRDHVSDNPSQFWIGQPDKVALKLGEFPHVIGIYPRIRFPSFLTNGKLNVSALGEGIVANEEKHFFDALKVDRGRPLTVEEDGILLGDGIARALNVHPGDTVTLLTNDVHGRLSGADLKVVGIYMTGLKAFDDVFFRIQLSKAQELLSTEKAEYFSVGLRQMDGWPEFARWAKQKFPQLGMESFEEIDRVYYENSIKFLDNQFALMLTVFLAIGVIGVFNITTISVLERTRELGILRVNGESRLGITSLVLWENLLSALGGGILGIGIAYLLTATILHKGILMPPAPGFSNEYYAQIVLSFPRALSFVAVGCLAAGVGTIPALIRVSRTELSEALRHV